MDPVAPQDIPNTAQSAPGGDTSQAATALGTTKMPFDKKWWQLPRTVSIIIAAVFLLSIGSTAYLFFAPQNIFKPKPSSSNLLAQNQQNTKAIAPTPTQAPAPTDGVILVDTLTPTPAVIGSPTPTGNPTISWLTFKNYVYGYSFKYPPDWTATDLGNSGTQTPSEITVNPSTTATPSTALNITVTTSTRTFAQEVALRSSARSAITINGLTASLTQEQDSNGNKWSDVVVQGKNYTYILVGKSGYASTFTSFYNTFTLL